MAKKKRVRESSGLDEASGSARPGRPPKRLTRLSDCFRDFNEHTEAWLSRFAKVWFPPPKGPLEEALGAV